MIERQLSTSLLESSKQFPIVTLLGPRQAGKTTLCKALFKNKPYVSLEPLDVRQYAKTDPREFLAQFPHGAVLDEIQNVPELFSYLQEIVDKTKYKGLFILTGSENFTLSAKISQSLAGRTAIETLLPFSFGELKTAQEAHENLWEQVWKGSYPRIYDDHIPPQKWLASYLQTYVEKDVRQILNITDNQLFSTFITLLASHTGQEVNYHALSSDVGVSHNTIKKWTGVLQQSFLVYLLPAWYANIKKQILKRPKLHFIDTGLVCYLLGITSPEQLRLHPLRGAIFETWVVSEIYKQGIHQGRIPRLFHYRENMGLEFDLLESVDSHMIPYEIKSGMTFQSDFLKSFKILEKRKDTPFLFQKGKVIYGGAASQTRGRIQIVPWYEV
jgi:uncharacterized protein